MLEGVVGVECVILLDYFVGFGLLMVFDSSRDRKKLVDVKETEKQTTLCLAAAHALVRLDDSTIVGDPMEKTTLEALDWKLSKGLLVLYQPRTMLIQLVHAGETIAPSSAAAPHRTQLTIRRRFQFSSALKCMSTISSLPGGRTLAAVKGAPDTIKGMSNECPEWYDQMAPMRVSVSRRLRAQADITIYAPLTFQYHIKYQDVGITRPKRKLL